MAETVVPRQETFIRDLTWMVLTWAGMYPSIETVEKCAAYVVQRLQQNPLVTVPPSPTSATVQLNKCDRHVWSGWVSEPVVVSDETVGWRLVRTCYDCGVEERQ